MKLYTEEEIKKTFGFVLSDMDLIEYINTMKPISLPSDEEIEEIIKPFEFEYTKIGFKACAEWIKNKIQGGNK